MARNKEYLLKEAKKLKVSVNGDETISELMDKLMVVKAPEGYIKNQIATMSAQDAKKFLDYSKGKPWDTEELNKRFWNNPGWIAEVKLDGVRMKGHIQNGKWRFDTRARSDVTYIYTENTDKFPHFNGRAALREFNDTVLDGEFLMPVDSIDTKILDPKGKKGSITKGTLTTTMAVIGSDVDKAIKLQEVYGPCEYYLFDILKYKGRDITQFPWYVRRRMLEGVFLILKNHNPYLKITTPMSDKKELIEDLYLDGVCGEVCEDLKKTFETITAKGGEGLMFKKIVGKYAEGKKSADMWKLKKFESFEGFITGYIPGKNNFKGMVGSLLVSVYLPNGDIHEIAAVSQMSLELRRNLTAEDGSLKKVFLDKVIEVKGQELTKNKRYRHAVLFRWRDDRSPESCVFDID